MPSVPVAEARLARLGVSVVAVESAPDNNAEAIGESEGRLPFPDESFSLVVSRHESFLAHEVARILQPDGIFLTQQVGGDYGDFYDALGLSRPPAPERPWDLLLAKKQLEAAGFEITESGEAAELTTFEDAGAFAWYLRAIPWTVEGFAIQTHRVALESLDERVRESGPLTVGLPAFWLEAIKRQPASSA